MLKRFLFAVAPMMLLAGSVMADDNLLSTIANLDLDGQKLAAVDVDNADDLGQADVDALLGDDAGSGEEAIAACFRRIGYGYGYRSYGHRHCYSSFYRSHSYYPSYHCYTPVTYHCYTPTYTYYTPVYSSYWGCW